MSNVFATFDNANGLPVKQKLSGDDLIEIARYEKAFAYSARPDFIEMTVSEALAEGQFDTSQGTMKVLARIEFEDGTQAPVHIEREMSDAERAESWYNGSSKAALIDWATRHGLDIGQGRAQLDDDWNERVMQAYAAQL